MSKTPLVTVIVTCYNYARYVEDAIASFYSQTYANKELIVVDDGSTDDSDEIIRALQVQNEFMYIRRPNGGAPVARNSGLKKANGDFIVFLDADDILPANYIESCVLLAKDSRADIVYCNSKFFGDQEGTTDFPEFNRRTIFYANYINATALIRSSLFKRHKYDEKLARLRFDDWDFYLASIKDGATAVLNKNTHILYRIKEGARSVAPIDKQIQAYRYVTGKYAKEDAQYAYSLGVVNMYMDKALSSEEHIKSLDKEIIKVNDTLREVRLELNAREHELSQKNQELDAIKNTFVFRVMRRLGRFNFLGK